MRIVLLSSLSQATSKLWKKTIHLAMGKEEMQIYIAIVLALLTSIANAQEPARFTGNPYVLGEKLKVTRVVNENLILTETGSGQVLLEHSSKRLRPGKVVKTETRYFEYVNDTTIETGAFARFKPITKAGLLAKFPRALHTKDSNKRLQVLDVVSKDDDAKTVRFRDPVSLVESTVKLSELKGSDARYVKKWTPEVAAAIEAARDPVAGDTVHGVEIELVWVGKVVAISDGDTATVLNSDNVEVKIRLNGIDTPESEQAFGAKSKEALGKLIFGKQVTVLNTGKDRWKRQLGFLRVDGVDVNAMMVRHGFAWHYKDFNSSRELADFELSAREAKAGLWGGSEEPVPPWEFRKQK